MATHHNCMFSCRLPIQDFLGDNQRILATLVSPAADEIAAVQLRLDSLALQIQHSSRQVQDLPLLSLLV